MFGNKSILGTYCCSVDSKSRIYISPKTGREIGEELIVCQNEEKQYFIIYSENTISKKIHELNTRINNATTTQEKTELEKLLWDLLKSIISKSKVDSQGRINLSENALKNTKVDCIGAIDCLILKPKLKNK